MASEALISIVAAEAKAACAGIESTADRLRAAMKSAANHWMVLEDEPQFLGAVAAVYSLSDDATKDRLKQEMAMLRALNAAMSGVPVDMSAAIPNGFEAIGLMAMWREIKAEVR